MPINMDAVRIAALVLIVGLLYGSRLTTGNARQTSAGLVFAMKPLVVFSRITAMIIYLGFFGYIAVVSGRSVPPWFYLVFAVAIGLGLLQYPGTITLGPEAITQTFWFLKAKRIAYPEVMTIQKLSASGAVRVLGDNRTAITHTNNHSASLAFQAELERLTGKKIT
jgi:hypothetical protein